MSGGPSRRIWSLGDVSVCQTCFMQRISDNYAFRGVLHQCTNETALVPVGNRLNNSVWLRGASLPQVPNRALSAKTTALMRR